MNLGCLGWNWILRFGKIYREKFKYKSYLKFDSDVYFGKEVEIFIVY